VQRIGHALKGVLVNLTATVASRVASELESMGKCGDIALAKAKVNELEKQIARAVETLEGLCLETAK
jgi:hypothetical protein